MPDPRNCSSLGATGTLNQFGGTITNLSTYTWLGQGGGHGNWPQHGNGQFHHRQWQQMMPFPGQMGPGQMGPGMMGPR